MSVPPDPVPDWDNTAWVIIQDGVTYIEADAVGRWLDRASQGDFSTRDLSKMWEDNVNHLVRYAIEKESKKWWHW
jgi:hypothetical protein